MKTYNIKTIEKSTVEISGKDDSSIWNEAVELTDFSSPWDAKLVKKIAFKAVCNSERIFFQFKVYDHEIHIQPSDDKNDSINNSDRVELFFRIDASLNPYYCLEIDPTARIMDFKALPNKNFDFNWEWPAKDIEVKSSATETHFVVEIAISLASLKAFNVLKDGLIEAGIYRAKYNKMENGTYEPTWITWVDPNTEQPNFHTPTSFGVLKIEKT